jgi:hypothetical protein
MLEKHCQNVAEIASTQEMSDFLLLKTYHTVWYDLDNECDNAV